MKNRTNVLSIRLFGIIIFVALIGFSMITCSDPVSGNGSGSGSGSNTPGGGKPPGGSTLDAAALAAKIQEAETERDRTTAAASATEAEIGQKCVTHEVYGGI